MIRAGQVGRRATWNLGEFAKLCDVPDDTELDDKGQTVISYIDVSFGRVIRSIQFSYRENEALVLSEKYGSSDDQYYTNLSNESVVVKLVGDEYVTGLSGELGLCEGIRNLTFHTNLGKHGPIGKSEDNYASGSKVNVDPEIRDRRGFGGFFGSYNSNGLSSIGIYAIPVASPETVA